ncbi:hypothetical protein OCU04_000583 [Sclerotinia nivalis]|uniref:Uncharacterized protein n=1 Tax=Sclerotinia nivalis TaxID=352851 RepID=A0A9X0AX16_9HELO|nr:hypothetical protein OCU04_000583 [Sclerotinia nivalis]
MFTKNSPMKSIRYFHQQKKLRRSKTFLVSISPSISQRNPTNGARLPSDMSHVVLSDGLLADDKFIPAGTNIGTSGWAISYNKEYVPGRFVFRPERYIVDDALGTTIHDVNKATSAFNRSSISQWNCAGQKLVLLEMWILVVRMLGGWKGGAGGRE